jgi:hypothetical protein
MNFHRQSLLLALLAAVILTGPQWCQAQQVENVFETRKEFNRGKPHRHVLLLNSDWSYRITVKGDRGFDPVMKISGPFADENATQPSQTKPLGTVFYDDQKDSLKDSLGPYDTCALMRDISQRDAGYYLVEVWGYANRPGSYLINVQRSRKFD